MIQSPSCKIINIISFTPTDDVKAELQDVKAELQDVNAKWFDVKYELLALKERFQEMTNGRLYSPYDRVKV